MGYTNHLFQVKATTLKEDIHTMIVTHNRTQVEHTHNLNMVNHLIAILGTKKMN
jgi:hypothetical protein